MRKQAWKNQPVTALVFDLDHFKSINDRFGHAVGDETLRLFARTLALTLRSSDVIGRLGGEEFAALLPNDLTSAAAAGERVRAAIEVVGAEVDGHRVEATVSIGAAAVLELPCDLEALLARADAALYRAKANGRNRLESDVEPAAASTAGGPAAPAPERRADVRPEEFPSRAHPGARDGARGARGQVVGWASIRHSGCEGERKRKPLRSCRSWGACHPAALAREKHYAQATSPAPSCRVMEGCASLCSGKRTVRRSG